MTKIRRTIASAPRHSASQIEASHRWHRLAMIGLVLFMARAAGAADVLTQHNDNARTGANT